MNAQLDQLLKIRDLTDPSEGPHALQLVLDNIVSSITTVIPCTPQVHRGNRVVDVADNYDKLRYAPDAVTRDTTYTRYVTSRTMLRSHMTSAIPSALETLPRDNQPRLVVAPGIVYRRDCIDRLHSGTPHQADLWLISPEPLTEVDLTAMIEALVAAIAPSKQYRTEQRTHPYTLHGRQVDVEMNGSWVEIGECGLAHPELLTSCGLAGYYGLAMGVGLDRLTMLAKDIPDIRLIRSTDPKIANQMLDLNKYIPVSKMPVAIRDVSIAVDAELDLELAGDVLRNTIGSSVDLIEDLELMSTTPADDLPLAARDRLGIQPGQVNWLLRLHVRAVDRTLTAAEANGVRDAVYAALHAGAALEVTVVN